MKVTDTPAFLNRAHVRIALGEKGATDKVTFVVVDVMNKEHRAEAFLAKNPDAVVPCMELDDGTYLSHCIAITEYIDGHFEGVPLCGELLRNAR